MGGFRQFLCKGVILMAGGTITPINRLGDRATTDPVTNTDQNTQSTAEQQNYDNLYDVIGGSNTYNDSVNSLDSRVTALESAATGFKEKKTDQNGGIWFDCIFNAADYITFRAKQSGGFDWMASRLNDGSYLEDSTNATITKQFSLSLLDGIGAVQNNSWYAIIAYENSSNQLDFGFQFMPATTIFHFNKKSLIRRTRRMTLISHWAQRSTFRSGSIL